MKISNETKIGALTAVAITVLILGYSFLKGNDVFSGSNKFYAIYNSVEGLTISKPVLVNGFQIVPVRLFFNNRYWKDLDYKENLNQYGLKIFLSGHVTLTLRFRWCPKHFGVCVSFEPM